MTRTHALRCLLQHGALTWSELLDITGWPAGSLKSAITRLIEYGCIEVEPVGRHANRYCLL